MLVSVSQIVNLKPLQKLLDGLVAGEESRHDHKGAGVLWDAARGVHARQQSRRQQIRDVPVQHAQGQVARRNQREQGERDEKRKRRPLAISGEEKREDYESRQHKQRAEIKKGRVR
jgi:hypothetical protein